MKLYIPRDSKDKILGVYDYNHMMNLLRKNKESVKDILMYTLNKSNTESTFWTWQQIAPALLLKSKSK